MDDSLFFGFLDAGITDVITTCPELFTDRDVLVTCMDSDTNTGFILERSDINVPFVRFGKFGVISGDVAVHAHARVFVGFDEVYLFKHRDWKNSSPTLFEDHFTSDRVELTKSVPNSLRHIVTESGAIIYLSDGCGLNVVSTDVELLKGFERFS